MVVDNTSLRFVATISLISDILITKYDYTQFLIGWVDKNEALVIGQCHFHVFEDPILYNLTLITSHMGWKIHEFEQMSLKRLLLTDMGGIGSGYAGMLDKFGFLCDLQLSRLPIAIELEPNLMSPYRNRTRT